jgi:putative membrane protein
LALRSEFVRTSFRVILAMPSDHRLHPSSILFALAGSLRAFLLPAVFLMLTSRSAPQSSDPTTWGPAGWMNRWMPGDFAIANWQFWIMLFLIPATVMALARYVSFRLRYEGTELVISSGILFRNERHVPYARIQNLDAVRNVAHRLFGVAEVRVETGGGQTPEATISVLHERVFEEMRRRVFAGRALVVAEETELATQDSAETEGESGRRSAEREGDPPSLRVGETSHTLLHLPTRELLLNGLLDNRGMVLIATAWGVLWEAGLLGVVSDRLASGIFRRGFVRETARELATGDILAFLVRVVVIAIGIIAVLALVRVISMVWSVMRLHDFRLSRVGDDLRTEYGLLTRVTATIPLKRVQSLTVRETPLQRLVDRMAVRVETAGGHGSPHNGQPKQPREWLAPIIRQSAVPALVREVLPGFAFDGFDWQPLHPRAFRRAIKPALLISLITAMPFVYFFGWAGLVVLAITAPLLSAVTWAHIRYTQWAATGDTLILRTGWLWRQVTVVPIAKIQVVGRVESPFDRRAAMAGVRVDTAGSASPAHRISIPYLARETAAALYERLATQTAQTAFRW